MNPIIIRSLILISIGALSLWSVWTSTNRWLSGIFGIGGMLLILIGIFSLQAWAEEKNKARLSDEYDPDFKFNKKRLDILQTISGIVLIISFFAIIPTQSWWYTLFNKLYFALVYGGLGFLFSYLLIAYVITPRVPEMRYAHEDVERMIFAYIVSLSFCIYIACISTNYFTAINNDGRKGKFIITSVEEDFNNHEAISIKISEGDERTFPTTMEFWENAKIGDSVKVDIKKGVLGFEHFFNFEKK